MERIFFLFAFLLVDSAISDVNNNVSRTNPCTDEGHMFLTPDVLTSGGTNRACVSRFHADGAARVLLTLVTDDQKTVTAARDLLPGDGGCIDITVPQMPNTKADLIVNIRYPEAQCTWERHVTVRIGAGRLAAVQTERARYRPGDTVRARIVTLKPDLTPAHTSIDEVWLEGPPGAWEGVRVAEWSGVRTRLGIGQVQHELDELAPPGRWIIRARLADGSQGAAAFWVGNYELPPFQLSVRHAPRVLRTSERLVWTVCVRYPWTEAVEGMLVIRIRGAATREGIRTAVRLRAPRACHRHAAAAKRIGLDAQTPPSVVVADFSFQEEGTRIWQNTTVVSQVVESGTLEFLTKHRAVISPGLPYKLKVKATRWDDKPQANARVRVCKSSAQATKTEGECNEAVTDDNGVARVMFRAGDDGATVYKFEATLQNDTSTSAPPLFLPVQRSGSVHAALGPLKADPYGGRTFVPLYLNVRNISTALTVHFVVITRGGIIYRWGATTQCPVANSGDQIQTATRNSPCPRPDAIKYDTSREGNRVEEQTLDSNTSDALLDRHFHRVMLPIKITHQMCPDSHLVAYFYVNGELVSASKHFEMEECFANKVEATWSSRQAAPGSTISLTLSTPGPALCALTALDSASRWIQPPPTTKDVILGGLKKLIDGHRNLTEYDAAGECFLTSDTPDVPKRSSELTAAWLAAAGVRIIGGNIQKIRSCSAAPMPLIADEMTVPRSDFSEAWLWRLVPVYDNGTVTTSARAPDAITRYEASAVCVSRTGIAVSAPAVLQVFREFFIHADSPKRLRRGDMTFIRYRLFNYLYEPLSVQIQVLTDPHLEGPANYVESACIDARSSAARRVELRARLPGNARLSIRAKSVRDGGCANVTTSRVGVSDEVIIQMTVDPEGVPVQEHKSILLCGRESQESSTSEVLWQWPQVQSVPGTETLTAWAVADLTAPLLADADDLVLLPRGCGEQNMARLATNLLALRQLDSRTLAAVTARLHVARGFTRQLQYIHPEGGFSAFGPSDTAPSTWLTAFAVRYLRKAHQALTPGQPVPPALDRAERWLISQQMENGCFRNEGQVFHRELRGGLNEESEIASVALTAYVITSLVESSILPARILRNAFTCLRALPPSKSKISSRVYAHSLLAYAFMRLRRYEGDVKGVNEAELWERGVKVGGLERDEELRELLELLKMGKRSGDFVWWEAGSLATSIEATGYALLALSGCPEQLRDSCAHDARAAIRWLSTHRNSAGGFVATQDTLVALEALSTWTSLHPSPPANLTVTVLGSGSVKTVSLQAGTLIPDVLKMGRGDQLRVSVEGTGCALIQATRRYNTYTSDDVRDKVLSVKVGVTTDGPFNCDTNGTNCYCAAVIDVCVLWSGEFPEMALLEVSLPGGFGADAALLYSQLHQPGTLLRRIELTPSSSKASLYLSSRDTISALGHQCYKFHAVGPRAHTKPAHAVLLHYYTPSINDTQMYTIPEDCPPRINHESRQYLPSDNLYNKAKSLLDGDEILISKEFTFEDIPDGIPLEDPMYDNLTQNNDKNEKTNIEELVDINRSTEEKIEENANKDKSKHFDSTVRNNESSTTKDNTRNFKHELTGKLANFDDTERPIARQSKTFNQAEIPETDQTESNNEILKTNQIPNEKEAYVQDITGTESTDVVENQTHQNKEVENPNLAGFHVIDSDKDLEVPSGMEGPVPAVVLPPPFLPRVYVGPADHQRTTTWNNPYQNHGRMFQNYNLQFNTPTYSYIYQHPLLQDAYENKYRGFNPSAG